MAKDSVQQPNLFTVPEAAKFCGVSRNTLYTWVRSGKLPAYQTPGRTNLIRPIDLVQFMEENGMFVPPTLRELAQDDEKMNAGTQAGEPFFRQAVLVVDDDSVTRAMVVRALNERYHIYQAETGYEALHLLTTRNDIKLVLLDMRMPGQHGTETLTEMKKVNPDVGVLVISGFAGDIPLETRDDATVVGVLEKPVDIPTIKNAVEAAFEKVAAR